jgi:hypothetical protein
MDNLQPQSGAGGVMDMVNQLASDQGTSADDVFKRDTTPVPPPEESTIKPVRKDGPKPGGWQPSDELTEDMEELQGQVGVVYDKDEVQEGIDTELQNITDDMVAQEAVDQFDEMDRQQFNIDRAKAKLGIKHLQIPPGPLQVEVLNAASDTDANRGFQSTVVALKGVVDMLPEVVLEWLPGHGPQSQAGAPAPLPRDPDSPPMPAEFEDETESGASVGDGSQQEVGPQERTEPTAIDPNPSAEQAGDLKIIIDKSQAAEVVFDSEERDKITKARSVELEIREVRELQYAVIDDPDDKNDIDMVLQQYTRKFNDISVSLPASRYRCTLTGLSYPEILDLSYSQDLNNLDGERKKWTIAYGHIRNASIGQFADFNDFIQKTSYLDLDFILWGILCATCMPKEIVSIDCHTKNCGNSYDWLYSPNALLQLDKIAANVLEEMKVTGEASTGEEIEKNYNESMLKLDNSIKLPSSQFVICFGHVSAYTYLNHIYGKMQSLKESDQTMMSEAMAATVLPIIKYILLPNSTGNGYRKVTNVEDIMKVIQVLDNVDFKTLTELMSIMTDPYELTFVLIDILCPKCKQKSSITIEDMGRLLFIIAQSLSSVNVVLKRQ